jgi:hypothetical protein
MQGKKRMKRIACICLVCPLLTSCATSGTMQGMMRASGERITMSYEQAALHDDLQVTLPDGETFKGKVVMEGASTGLGYGSDTATGTAVGAVATYTGGMRGVLFGDKGHTMVCRFQYADPGHSDAGGVGLCETSDGKAIDMQW